MYNISASNYYTRKLTDYFFNVTIFEKLPTKANFGKIYIEFPIPDFDIAKSPVTCDSTT